MNDLQQNSQLNWAIGCIDNEIHILARLLYRNNNQHGKSLIFSHLKGLNKHVKLLTAESCQKLLSNLDASVRLAKQHKISQLQFEEILSVCESVYLATSISLIGVSHGSKAAESLIKLLGNKVFVPLYSLLVALTSRITKCLSILAVNCHTRLIALCDQIKHIGVIHEKYSSGVKAFLKTVALTDDETKRLGELKSVLEVHASGAPSSSFKKKTLSFGEISQKSMDLAISNTSEDFGDIIGSSRVANDTFSRGNSAVNDSDNEVGFGMAIDSDDEEKTPVVGSSTKTSSSTAVQSNGSIATDNSTIGKKRPNDAPSETNSVKSIKTNDDAKSNSSGLAIDPNSLFSDEPAVTLKDSPSIGGTKATAAPEKSNFKKKKTLKAQQRREERKNREQAQGKDDIDDIFGKFI